ncbi:unnamed protein product [Sphagnum troendelagicum]
MGTVPSVTSCVRVHRGLRRKSSSHSLVILAAATANGAGNHVLVSLAGEERKKINIRSKRRSREAIKAVTTSAAASRCPTAVMLVSEAADLQPLINKAADTQILNMTAAKLVRKLAEKKNLPSQEPPAAAANALLESKPATIRVKRKKRLDLVSRVALRQKTCTTVVNKTSSQDSKFGNSRSSNSSSDYDDLWSDRCEQLISKYTSALDLMAVSWEKVDHVLLTAEEERTLAFLMRPLKGMVNLRTRLREEMATEPNDEEVASAANMNLPTFRRQLLLCDAARNKLIQHNLRLVLSQAHKYFKESMSLSVVDLCQEGILGLIHGVDKFDPRKGYRLSTYAIYWIRNSILRAQTRSGHLLRTPFNIAAHKQSIKRTSMDLLMEKERAPTHKEVMERLGLGQARYRNILQTGIRPGSMHARCRITGKELVENLVDKEDQGSLTWKFSGDVVLRCGMDDVLDSLKPKESLVLRQRFGLDGKGERSLEEIGRNLNLSREMVRRYEMRALLKMKHPTRVEYLRGYLT